MSQPRSSFAAILAMLAAMSLLPVVDAISKHYTGALPASQITALRYAAHVAIVAPLVLATHGAPGFRPLASWAQAARGALMGACTILFVAAMAHMPIAEAQAAVLLYPCLVTALSPWALGERIGPVRWAAVTVGFLGVLFVIRPGAEVFNIGGALAVASAICYAGYVVLTRRLSAGAPPLAMLLTMGVFGGVAAWIWAVGEWRPMDEGGGDLIALAAMGALAALVHLLIILAYTWGEASVIAPLGYFQIVGGVALGWWVFGDFPDLQAWAGVALVVSSGLVIGWREQRRAAT